MAILKVANVHHDASGFTRTQISTANTYSVYTSNAERMTVDPAGNMTVTGFAIASSMNLVPTIQGAFGQANTARLHANNAHLTANAGFNQANTARLHANNAHLTANAGFNQANTARDHANTAHLTANAAFGQANTARLHANNAHLTANAGFDQANTARLHANNAYNKANNALANTTGTFAGDLTIIGTGNVSSSFRAASLGVGTAASGTVGEIRAANNITAYFSSDKKFKENIRDIENAVNIIDNIGGKYFDWTDKYVIDHGGEDGYFIRKSDFGVIAQDVQNVFPIAVRERQDGTLAVDYEKLVALAFAAIRELKNEIEKLKR